VNGTLKINATASVPTSGTACNGVYTGAFRGSILVAPNQVCIIDGGSVSGAVVSLGGIVGLYNVTVGGDVGIGRKYTGSAANLQHSVCGSTVKGSSVNGSIMGSQNTARHKTGQCSGF
jgi:hypothetical protein